MFRFPQRFVLSGVAFALVVGLGLVAWVLATGSSEAQSGTMHNCPAVGKWSIAVWDDSSGTAAADALATCGAGAVDAAYALDPQTGGWLRWFAGKPEASNLPPFSDKQGVLALGSATGPVATPTPSATPAAEATPTGQYSFTFPSFYSEPDTFRGTVQETRLMGSIPAADPWPTVTPPAGGEFAAVLMGVANIENEGAAVGVFAFRLRDNQGRLFTMDFPESLSASVAAEAYFDRHGLYDTVMPGMTLDMVFVFLVPTGTTGLVAERCPASGC